MIRGYLLIYIQFITLDGKVPAVKPYMEGFMLCFCFLREGLTDLELTVVLLRTEIIGWPPPCSVYVELCFWLLWFSQHGDFSSFCSGLPPWEFCLCRRRAELRAGQLAEESVPVR